MLQQGDDDASQVLQQEDANQDELRSNRDCKKMSQLLRGKALRFIS